MFRGCWGIIVLAILIMLLASLDRQCRKVEKEFSCTYGRALRTPWYYYGLVAIGVTAMMISLVLRRGASLDEWLLMVGVACFGWLRTLQAFLKERPQWSLRTMLLFGIAVAVFCSISRFLPPREFLLVLAIGTAIVLRVSHYVRTYRLYQQTCCLDDMARRNRESPCDESPNDRRSDQALR